MKDALKTFLDEHSYCVISTIAADGKPQAAMVGYVATDECEIIIGTSSESRKYANLTQRPNVAIVIGDDVGVVQLEGVAELLNADSYDAMVKDGRIAALPNIEMFRQDPSQVFVKISPSWIRFMKTGENGGKEEFTEF